MTNKDLNRSNLTGDTQKRNKKVTTKDRDFPVLRKYQDEERTKKTYVGKKLYKLTQDDYNKMTVYVSINDEGKKILCDASGNPLNFDKSHLPEEDHPPLVIISDGDQEKLLLSKYRSVMTSQGEELIHHTNLAGLGNAVKYALSLKKIRNGRIVEKNDLTLHSGHFRQPNGQDGNKPSMQGFVLEKFQDFIDEDLSDDLNEHNLNVQEKWKEMTRGRSSEEIKKHRHILRTPVYNRALPKEKSNGDSDEESVDLT